MSDGERPTTNRTPMKRITLAPLKPTALLAVGVLLGRCAQADTTLDFNSLPSGQANNQPILQSFGEKGKTEQNTGQDGSNVSYLEFLHGSLKRGKPMLWCVAP